MTPGPGAGRFGEDLRLIWASFVREVLSAAEGLRAAAVIVGMHDGKKGIELLRKADKLEDEGPEGAGKNQGGYEEAVAEWEKMCGVDTKDPEAMKKVYETAAALRRMETEAADSAAMKAAKAREKFAAVQRRRRRGKR